MTFKSITAALALTAILAGCSGEPAVSNEDAALQIFESAFGQSPADQIEEIAGNHYSAFEMIRGFGGERGESWDEERFKNELATAFAPFADQINAAYASSAAADMEEGEGQNVLDMLAQGKGREYAACIFDLSEQRAEDPFTSCQTNLGFEASQELQDALGDFARRTSGAFSENEVISAANGYATCKVFAMFGEEVSTETMTLGLGGNDVGLAGNNKPCEEYDAPAAELLEGDTKPNFPADETDAEAEQVSEGVSAE